MRALYNKCNNKKLKGCWETTIYFYIFATIPRLIPPSSNAPTLEFCLMFISAVFCGALWWGYDERESDVMKFVIKTFTISFWFFWFFYEGLHSEHAYFYSSVILFFKQSILLFLFIFGVCTVIYFIQFLINKIRKRKSKIDEPEL